ncbi:nudix hydrolase 17, mitochondrial-like [Nicotiana tabacum]|uniref:Nudix hydrolase 17, mitochondrial-like n=1 Tax=Nicotiana tabacum TaxID=4097 RepID=A0A1S3Z324_TOBAC|nr:nudix hydrolase 17, mitochondrial-like [Nicotiana tomentosiformis]XP_016458836.1 PREDICTED: nudix hydrolase 17, mitochondrial-like [Nicotiana tabacum]
MELKEMVVLVSRSGRHLQRYNKGRRQVVGCIPYRYKDFTELSMVDEDAFEVLLISPQRKGKGLLFPKGGWEKDETIEDAAQRETVEEAGVRGEVECKLGTWYFENKSGDTAYEGHMFPLFVTEQLDSWPEKEIRERTWMSVCEARRLCQNGWMKEALELLVSRFTSQSNRTKGELYPGIERTSSGRATILPLGCRAQLLSLPLPSSTEEA